MGGVHDIPRDYDIQRKQVRLQFLIGRGHVRGPRRRNTCRHPRGLVDLTLRQYIAHAGKLMRVIPLRIKQYPCQWLRRRMTPMRMQLHHNLLRVREAAIFRVIQGTCLAGRTGKRRLIMMQAAWSVG